MNWGMRFFSGKRLFWGTVFAALCLFLPSAGASVPEYDLARMRQLNPDFSTYPEARGIVWLKRVSCAPGRDGGMERTHLWVLLGRSGLEDRWLNWEIPEPPGGRTKVLEAGVYAFDSGRKIADVLPEERSQGGVTMRSVRFAPLPETFILVLCWQDSLAAGLSVEGLIWTQEALPVWESIVEVTVPDGRPFHYRSLQGARPEVKKGAGDSIHTWRAVNTEPLVLGRLRAASRSGVVFSMRQGAEGIARLMRDRAAVPVPPAPPAAVEGFRKGPEAGTAALLSWLYAQPEAVLPEDCSRSIPAVGPWTRGEKLLLAHAWLRDRGVDVLLHWRMPFEPDADSPVCQELLMEPVLEILPFKGGKSREGFFCDMDDAPRMGRTSPLLMGSRIFRPAENGRLASGKVPDAKAADNRLRVLFDLRLNPGGTLGGTVRLQARGAWRPLLFRGWEDDRAERLLSSLFRNLRGVGEVAFKDSKAEAELSFGLKEMPGILGTRGKNLLVILPAFVPETLRSLADGPVPLELRIPFLLEQRVVLALPPGTEKVMLPADTERAFGKKLLYGDSFKASKLKRVTAEARLQVSATRLEEDDVSSLKSALELWRNFSARPLPVQMRGGE